VAEVTRLARKELRNETDGLKKAVSAQRFEIAALKRRITDLEKTLKSVTRAQSRGVRAPADSDEQREIGDFRFRAQGLASNRKRLGLSAEDFGLLVGTSGQSIYAWEQGKSKPRAKNLAAIAALRGIGKRDVAARLEALKQEA
jgi:DNA-binding transcriptional regulator YiaG